jgi:hypothetical protein
VRIAATVNISTTEMNICREYVDIAPTFRSIACAARWERGSRDGWRDCLARVPDADRRLPLSGSSGGVLARQAALG